MRERGDVPADEAEKRDWDLPPMGGADADDEAQRPDEPGGEPPDESERRDWDLP